MLFYPVPAPLPPAKPGTVIWARPFTGGPHSPDAAANTLVLYHTVSAAERDVAVSGVVSIPKGTPPSGGWPVISWSHGTTGNAPQCAPSQASAQNGEQRFLNSWLAMGYAVAQTDYEGEGTPGIHPYFASTSGAHDTIDIVRAARALNPQISSRWLAMGHSEGGTVALFTAALAPTWAPDLQLLGAVSFAPASHITDALGQVMTSQQPTSTLPLQIMMVEGIASVDPEIDLKTILSPQGLAMLPQLQSACIGDLMNSARWNSVPPASLFLPQANVDELLHDFRINEPLNLPIHVPLLLEQGADDELVSPAATESLASNLCANGVAAELNTVEGATHGSIMSRSFEQVKDWVAQRLSGAAVRHSCTSG
ncbi:MAG: alpha/beta hydrolase [Candidatus Eremiobacteraeota bacterium]|nr:alpha/beta hydrolase [Candidatus Eremiobacteraeota bacterium]